jgi:C1A family cysteine protease
MSRLEDVSNAIRDQGLNWLAGDTPVGRRAEVGKLPGLGFTVKGREPAGGRGPISQQSFAFQTAVLPQLVDWRAVGRDEENYVTPVRDQKQCGACVSFATCAALESRIKMKREDADFDVNLSVADLFFCGTRKNGCEEGWQIGQALKHCRSNGVGKDADFRYKGRQTSCKDIDPFVHVPRWRRHKQSSDRKEAIRLRGPVIGAMVVYSDFLWYKGGVYRPTTAEALGLHAIAVIGYDDKSGSWIIKNSWGVAWGAGGFAQIGYGTCGVDAQFEFYDPEVELGKPKPAKKK